MKSIVVTTLMFACVLLAIYLRVFDIMSSTYMYIFGFLVLTIALIFALKTLGDPFQKKDDRDEKK